MYVNYEVDGERRRIVLRTRFEDREPVEHTDLIFEILHLFGAKPLAEVTNADHSLVIHPLPKVPFLINYWMPEDDFESKLTILFDRSAEVNSNIESLYLLGRGLVEMFRALIVRHSKDGKLF